MSANSGKKPSILGSSMFNFIASMASKSTSLHTDSNEQTTQGEVSNAIFMQDCEHGKSAEHVESACSMYDARSESSDGHNLAMHLKHDLNILSDEENTPNLGQDEPLIKDNQFA